MMQVKWTPQQESAVFGEKANCLVSAAAGSGKTQVLTGRILRRIIEEKLDISRILVVTFTNAAAAEMRARITKSIQEELVKTPKDEHLKNQLSLMGTASIMTIHAFCLQLLRTHFTEAGIDAGFRVGDTVEIALMRTEAAQAALDELFAEKDADFLEFANCYTGMKSDEALCELLYDLHAFSESMPAPTAWRESLADAYEELDFGESVYAKTLLQAVRTEFQGAKASFEAAAKTYALSASFGEVFLKDAQTTEKLIKACDSWDGLCTAILDMTWERRRPEKGYDDAASAEEIRKNVKKQVDDACNKIVFTSKEATLSMQKAASHVRALCRMGEVFEKHFMARKQEKSILDYGDLEHLAIRLLSDEHGNPSAIAEMLREKYDEIYIDEYQDSNDVQEHIFNLISREKVGEPNLFMVGDMKQSIYGFRKTSPALFIEKCKTYGREGKNKRIVLSRNFRSRPEILAFINRVFSRIMTPAVGDIAYTEDEMLYPGAIYPPTKEPLIKFSIINTDSNAGMRLWEEAYGIANEIKTALQGTVFDQKLGKERPVKFSDIVVLMRSAREMAVPLESACREMGIPLYCDVGGGYFETTEIKVFLSLLSVIDNPQDDIPLLATMRAPFFGFTDSELAEIRLCDRERLYYFAVKKAAELDSPLGEKCAHFLQKLRIWRQKAMLLSTDALILELFEDTGYLSYVNAGAGGEKSRANLELLFEKAHQFEKTSFRGLFHFLRFVERAKHRSSDFGEAKMVTENDNVVRLMTIHKSKGLEFPIVIFAGTAKGFNKRGTYGNFLFHKDLGVGIRYIDPKLKIRYATPAHTAVATKIHDEEVGEELRVLYVCLTRAKEKLVIMGTGSLEKFYKAWRGGLAPSDLLHADSFLTVLGRCVHLADSPDEGVIFEVHAPYTQEERRKDRNEMAVPLPPDDFVHAILSYQYPKESIRRIPSKISVTEYKRLAEAEHPEALRLYQETALKTPQFLQMRGNIRGASFGTLMHFVMQNLPIGKVESEEDVKRYIDELSEKKMLSEEQAAAVNIRSICRFLQSDIGIRMKNADRIMREEPFTMSLPASLITQNPVHKDERIIVQGIIDCFFFQGDKITLVDYKTDSQTDREVIIRRYQRQIDLYAMALKQKYFSEISEKVIYLFANNDIIVLP